MRSVSVFLLINTSYPVDDIAMDIRLWTWQKKTEFDLANGEQKVESLDNSVFADSPNIMRAYNKLFKKLGTDQFHWYFTQEYEAKNNPSHIQWYKQGCMLWEVKVPIERIFKKVCGIAWTYLLNRPAPPGQLYHDWKKLSGYDPEKIEQWEQNFKDFWEKKSEQELWDNLFMETFVDGCTDVLLLHPLEKSWITRNPIEEGKWWEVDKAACGSQKYFRLLPCDRCSGQLKGGEKIVCYS